MRLIILAVILMIFQSCASIMGAEEYVYKIETDPPEMEYTVTDRAGIRVASGVTPDVISLASGQRFFRKQEYHINIKGPGSEEIEILSPYYVEGMYAGNLVFGWLIGLFIVDPATGAMYRPAKSIIDTTFSDNISKVRIIIGDGDRMPLTESQRRVIMASDDMY